MFRVDSKKGTKCTKVSKKKRFSVQCDEKDY